MEYSLNDIWFSYGSRPVFQGITLRFDKGRFHGILGPNGSGKSTLLDLLTGHLKPDKGQIKLNTKNLSAIQPKDLAKECSLVPQDYKVNFPFSVEQVVMMGRYPHLGRFGAPGGEDNKLVEDAMKETGIFHFSHRPVTELSGGERQRVVFARALAQDAKNLILDEATSSLDIRHTLKLMALAADRVRKKSLTVISVMQDINLAARFCESLLFLKNGRTAAMGKVKDVLTRDVIGDVFEVEAKVYFDETVNCRQVTFL